MAALTELQTQLQELEAKRPDLLEARYSKDRKTRSDAIAGLEILDEDRADLREKLEAAQQAEIAEKAQRDADGVRPFLSPFYDEKLKALGAFAAATAKVAETSRAYSDSAQGVIGQLRAVASGSDRIQSTAYLTSVDGVHVRTYEDATAGAVCRIISPLLRQLGYSMTADDLASIARGTPILPPNPFSEDEKDEK